MSKTESEYEVYLRSLVGQTVRRFRYEAVRFELAPRTTYTPDFMVVRPDGQIEFHEVKGSWKAPHQDDSRVKLKVAAEMYPEFVFVSAVRVPQKKGGGFEFEVFGR